MMVAGWLLRARIEGRDSTLALPAGRWREGDLVILPENLIQPGAGRRGGEAAR